MVLQINKSIKSFLKELKTRIELYSSTKVTENISNSKMDEINKILNHYNISDENAISPTDLKKISVKDLEKLLFFVGETEENIGYLLSQENYSAIAEIVNTYISDYISIGTTQNKLIQGKITTYQKYIKLFEQKKLSEPFVDLEELQKIMFEVGITDEDKWQILMYIATQNSELVNCDDFNLGLIINSHLESFEEYFSNEDVISTIIDRLNGTPTDIDTIPTVANELAASTSQNKEVITDMISIIIAANLFNKLVDTKDDTEKEEIQADINILLSNIIPLKHQVIYEAESIKNQNFEFFYNSIQSGITDDLLKLYVELPLSDIEKETSSKEHAIDLKELTVLKPMFETLETIKTLETGSHEYQKAINILKKLVEQYRILEEKKVTKVKI